ASYTQLSGNGASGLASGGSFDLIGDPSNFNRLYAGTVNGVFRSSDGGATWTNVTPGNWTASVSNIEFAIHSPVGSGNNIVYVGEVVGGMLTDVWRSADQGANWLALGCPASSEDTPKAITGATNASPIVVTSNGHGLTNGETVRISGVGGNTAANGFWT